MKPSNVMSVFTVDRNADYCCANELNTEHNERYLSTKKRANTTFWAANITDLTQYSYIVLDTV